MPLDKMTIKGLEELLSASQKEFSCQKTSELLAYMAVMLTRMKYLEDYWTCEFAPKDVIDQILTGESLAGF